jgi:farnesyl-diphosphate farnesyltransferase
VTPIDQTVSTHSYRLEDILKQVSRSFYLTLAVIPFGIRRQIGLAYLFARAADTIADTDLIDRNRRLEFLTRFKAQFAGRINWSDIRAIKDALAPHQTDTGERRLLERLDDCFRHYLGLDAGDRLRIGQLMQTLTNGMDMDLTGFPGDTANHLTALQTFADLDRYIYFVAGCVGEFWTEMMHAHLPSVANWQVKEMATVGVRFGKGLQLTNVLKDVGRDLRRGRCYIPGSLLHEAGLKPSDLLNPDNRPAFQPILNRLIAVARDHLDQGWLYTMAIPRRELRLRLACMWPILFAGETLRLVAASPDLLAPSVNVKMSKRRVYAIMALTMLTGGCGYVATAYWGRLRKSLGGC